MVRGNPAIEECDSSRKHDQAPSYVSLATIHCLPWYSWWLILWPQHNNDNPVEGRPLAAEKKASAFQKTPQSIRGPSPTERQRPVQLVGMRLQARLRQVIRRADQRCTVIATDCDEGSLLSLMDSSVSVVRGEIAGCGFDALRAPHRRSAEFF